MATVSLTVQLNVSHEPTDTLVVYVGTGDRLTLAESSGGSAPSGGVEVYSEAIGPSANDDPAPTRTLAFEVTPPAPERVAILAIGVAVRDAVGNESMLSETFQLVADYPSGVTPAEVAATANPNEATVSWSSSPQVEGASS